jgi:hypothetical protein
MNNRPSAAGTATAAQGLPSWIGQIHAEWHSNPRLRVGVLVVLAIALVTALLKLDDARQALRLEASSLAAENQRLGKMLSSDKQQQAAGRLALIQEQITRHLWQVPSTAVAQAELGTWLGEELVAAGAKEVFVAQATLKGSAPANSSEADAKPDAAAEPSATQANCGDTPCNLVELRTTVRFAFDAAVFPKALARIESAERPLVVEQLTVRPEERRVEMTVRALADIAPATAAPEAPKASKEIPAKPVPAQSSQGTEPTATTPAASEKALATQAGAAASGTPAQPPKIVEVKW